MKTRLYVLSGPDGAVRYAGKTVKPLEARLKQHLREAQLNRRKLYRSNWIRSIEYEVGIDLVEEVSGDGCSEEVELIAGLKKLGVPLVNQTKGGEGVVGYVFSKEARVKISVAGRGRVVSPETRLRISKALTGKKASPEAIETNRRSHAGRKPSKSPSSRARDQNGRIHRSVSSRLLSKPRGPKGGKRKLSAQSVKELLALGRTKSLRELSKLYGVGKTCIGDVFKRAALEGEKIAVLPSL